MDFDLIPKRERKGPIELQLTAMIDVFSMIVIFLIFGTVFGAADMVIPTGIEIPKSVSKEGIESAPRVVITKKEVFLSLIEGGKPVPLSDFHNPAARSNLKAQLKPALAEYQAKQKESKASVAPLNLLADTNTPYSDIFDVVVVFRELGFNTILFVANGVGGGGGGTGGGGGGR
jgi:biopolymer transport protein ExbD